MYLVGTGLGWKLASESALALFLFLSGNNVAVSGAGRTNRM